MRKLIALTVFAVFGAALSIAHAQSMQSVSCPYDGELAMWQGSHGNATSGYICTYSHLHLDKANNTFITHRFTQAC